MTAKGLNQNDSKKEEERCKQKEYDKGKEEIQTKTEFNPSISINVVHIDYSMIQIYNEVEISVEEDDDRIFEYQDSPTPVIRIFGSTCDEQRACVHIHGVSTPAHFQLFYLVC